MRGNARQRYPGFWDKLLKTRFWRWTRFVRALERGDVQEAQRWLATGVPVGASFGRGGTALHRAAAAGSRAGVRWLLDRGCDIEARDDDGATPLHRAATRGGRSADVLELLLDKGADPSARDGTGQTPVEIAAAGWRHQAVHLLVSRGADAAALAPGPNGLYWMAELGRVDEARRLLDAGRDPNGGYPQAPLHRAVAGGHTEVVELLLEHGADPNLPSANGESPLAIATEADRERIVALLVASGARPHGPGRGHEADHATSREPDTGRPGPPSRQSGVGVPTASVPGHAEAAGPGMSLLEAARARRGDLVRSLLLEGAQTALEGAISGPLLQEHLFIAECAFEAGVPFNPRDAKGDSLLHAVVRGKWNDDYRRAWFVESLLSNGADPNALDSTGSAPLHVVESTNIMCSLINHGADPNLRDARGRRPIETAAARGDRDAALFLAEHGGGTMDEAPETPATKLVRTKWDEPLPGRASLSAGATLGVCPLCMSAITHGQETCAAVDTVFSDGHPFQVRRGLYHAGCAHRAGMR
jgi:ankyrin repeat protein